MPPRRATAYADYAAADATRHYRDADADAAELTADIAETRRRRASDEADII